MYDYLIHFVYIFRLFDPLSLVRLINFTLDTIANLNEPKLYDTPSIVILIDFH